MIQIAISERPLFSSILIPRLWSKALTRNGILRAGDKVYAARGIAMARQSLGAAVPSDHLDTEISNSVIGCGEY